MSAEMRLKKLRGSGGYIMATINDDQQRKGNLGGPDLFLAPVGRIENERISKFYCNTCERDYEGAPQIQYENPNEEVAENLILVEKGQYICTNCNSTLAEYREFKKPEEAVEIGAARPLTPPTEPEPYTPPPPTITVPDFDVQRLPPSPTVQEDILTQPSQMSSFNSIAGMSVFDEGAKKIGTVKQVGVDASQNVVLVITKNDGSETTIRWNEIKKIGEIILLGQGGPPAAAQAPPTVQVPSPPPTFAPPPSMIPRCSSCGFENKLGSKFCQSCGSKL